MKTDDIIYVVMALLIVLVVAKSIVIRQEGISALQVVVDKVNSAIDFIRGIEPTTNNYYTEAKTTALAVSVPKVPSCLVWANRGAYCLVDCAGPGQYEKGARYCLNQTG